MIRLKALASAVLVAGFLFTPVLFGIGSMADIAPTSSTVEIFVGRYLGSGVYIGNGLVVTARHMVVGTRGRITVLDQAGERVSAKVEWVSNTTDVAVVKLQGELPHVGTAELDKRAPVMSEPLEVVGCPRGHPFVHTFGNVTSEAHDPYYDWQDAIYISAKIQPGNSGGPAYDKDGKVLGIIVGVIFDRKKRPIFNVMISAREVTLSN